MICPKCKTFQPTAETCKECGVIVAKMWAQQSEKKAPETARRAPSGGGSSRGLVAGVAVSLVAAVALGTWLLGGFGEGSGSGSQSGGSGRPGVSSYLEAAREAQRSADRMQERIAAANYAVEMGTEVYSTSDYAQDLELDVDLEKFAAELNAVARTKTVTLSASDLQRPFRNCSRFTNRYFARLRFGARDNYPIAPPQTEPYEPGGLDGRVRCEGDTGTVFLQAKPRTTDGISACWSKENAPRDSGVGSTGNKSTSIWVQMKWDSEVGSWVIYSRADQRAVDKERMTEARTKLSEDIARSHERQEEYARGRVPELVAKVEATRQELRVLASDANQRKFTKSLQKYERELRTALVNERFTHICETAASASLDAREKEL